MSTLLYSSSAAGLYLLAAGWWGYSVLRRPEPERAFARKALVAFGLTALAIHGVLLQQALVTAGGLNLGFYNALSLTSWVVALLVTLAVIIRPVENLALVFLPAAAVCLILEQLFPGQRLIPDTTPAGLQLHIILSVGAYGLLAIAAAQSIVLAIQEKLLRGKQPVQAMRVLPPLQTMENLLIQILTIGFFLLSLSVATGLMFVRDVLGQHLSHKIAFSIAAWLIFGLVLVGRWAWGWRGKHLVRWTLGGFAALVLAYFGSKLVLELILHRV
ncbi:MAG: cytochrome c biogenesis protein CcsA [Gammaproteobacteria bacterium]|nr:cytochrome c biogenesis protein CcsA [Gammaproteobacteria bacterium]